MNAASAMSLFLDYPVQLRRGSAPLRTAWCKTDPVLAVAGNDRTVSFYREEVSAARSPHARGGAPASVTAAPARDQGEQFTERVVTKETNATALAWHPEFPILAIGWENGKRMLSRRLAPRARGRSSLAPRCAGTLSLFHLKQGSLREDKMVHKSSITALKWSPEGFRLVSADAVRASLPCARRARLAR